MKQPTLRKELVFAVLFVLLGACIQTPPAEISEIGVTAADGSARTRHGDLNEQTSIPSVANPCSSNPDGGIEETVHFLVIQQGHQEGHQVLERSMNGLVQVEYTWKHNGHGPELQEEYILSDEGTYECYRVRGLSEWEAPVDESFRRSGEGVEWKSTVDAGDRVAPESAMYWPLGGTPDRFSVAIAALAQRSENTLPLIPNGSLTMRWVGETRVTRAEESRRVELLELRGFDLKPTYVWATTGEVPRLFALLEPGWLQVIEEEWEENLPRLLSLQEKAVQSRSAELAKKLAHPLPGVTVIRDVRVFDGENGTLSPPTDVYLHRGRISALRPAGSLRDADNVIDAAGRVLLPGLFDMHVHFDPEDGAFHMAAGVTTVRDMGNDNERLRRMMADVEEGRLLGPRIVPAGLIEGESEFSWRAGFVVDGLERAREAIDWYAQHGYRQIKLYNSFPKAILEQTTHYAHARGLRVSGHVPAFLRAEEAVIRGYDELQHVIFLMLNFFALPDTDTRTLARFDLPAEKTAGLDLDSESVQQFIELLATRGIVVDPTLATFDFLRQRSGELSQVHLAAVNDHLPPNVKRRLRVSDMNIRDDATAARYRSSYEKMVEFVGRLYRAGVPLVAGSDWTPGFTLQRELELYVEAGLTPAEALRVATWDGAKWAGVLTERGSVTPGKLADLVLVDGDPTNDISELRKISLVLKEGTAYFPSEIYQTVGIEPFVEPVPVRRTRPSKLRVSRP